VIQLLKNFNSSKNVFFSLLKEVCVDNEVQFSSTISIVELVGTIVDGISASNETIISSSLIPISSSESLSLVEFSHLYHHYGRFICYLH